MEDDILHKLLESRLIAIARGIPNSHIEAAVEALLQGGIRCVEVPFSRQGEIDTLEAIKLLKKRFGDQLLLGAGTVTNPNQVEAAAAAGATYIISPDCQKEVIERTKELGLVSMPGAFSPTEISAAYRWGADIVKVFPADSVGPAYFKAIKGPLPYIPLAAVGGVTPENAADFIKAGAVSIGIGNHLLNRERVLAGAYDEIRDTAVAFCARVQR